MRGVSCQEFFKLYGINQIDAFDQLIWYCLQKDPRRRPTLEQIHDIEWLQATPFNPTEDIFQEIMEVLA